MMHDNYLCPRCGEINMRCACVGTDVPDDPVNHPKHYTSHPSGIEAITICEHYNFNVGNAIKYLWRADLKGDDIEQLSKAKWYIEREIERRTKE